MSISETRRGGARGFTLAEVLIAAAVGAIIFLALYAGISNCFGLLTTSRANLRATQIIVSRLEGLRLEAWGDTNSVTQLFDPTFIPSTFTEYFYPLGLNGQTNNLGTVYSGTMTIQTNITLNPTASYSTNLALVTVSLTWTDNIAGHAVTHTRQMSTYVAKYGVQNYVISH